MVKPRPLRADAERNRLRVLEVAHEVFAAEGLAVPIDEIARRAGLGVGTLYRHFPTKESLFAAIVVSRMEKVVADARALLAHDTTAPDEALFQFLERMVEGWSQKKDFIDAIASAGLDLKGVVRAKKDLHESVEALVARAQNAGKVRPDVSVAEIFALLAGALGSLDRQGIKGKQRVHILQIIFDGLRARSQKPKTRPASRASR